MTDTWPKHECQQVSIGRNSPNLSNSGKHDDHRKFPPKSESHVTMNTRAGDNHSQVASAQRNIMQHYSTEWELQQVVELSAVDK